MLAKTLRMALWLVCCQLAYAEADKICSEVSLKSPLEPNVLLIVDESGSIDSAQIKQGLRQLVSETSSYIRYGISGFHAACGVDNVAQLLMMGQHSTSTLVSAINQLKAYGERPMNSALLDARVNNRLSSADDTNNASRVKAAILISDGEPNNCDCNCLEYESCVDATAREVKELLKTGVPTYFIGFNCDIEVYNEFAARGETGSYFKARDANELTSVLRTITNSVSTCSIGLEADVDVSRLTVTINDQIIDSENFWYDTKIHAVFLTKSFCASLDKTRSNQMKVFMDCSSVVCECGAPNRSPNCPTKCPPTSSSISSSVTTSPHNPSPSLPPTSQPTSTPNSQPTSIPTSQPTSITTSHPTSITTSHPTSQPTSEYTPVANQSPKSGGSNNTPVIAGAAGAAAGAAFIAAAALGAWKFLGAGKAAAAAAHSNVDMLHADSEANPMFQDPTSSMINPVY